ncbi:ankyrin [Trichoderma citrinoviride]|uniref:Ankyrin n=1 Tax=Trichoderma citrinoviride TaxID=58853 RepID=A0A2T4BMH7_9HYPO|nr:ankyrin [Trichoderma citrinoviride]PTB70469.1 ankyrin [Trichoderma citrinoviride]
MLGLFSDAEESKMLKWCPYMDKHQDILNFLLTSKQSYALYSETLHRHNVRYGGCSVLAWAARAKNMALAIKTLETPNVEKYAPKELWANVLQLAVSNGNLDLVRLLFELKTVQTSIKLASDNKLVTGLDLPTTSDLDTQFLRPMSDAADKGLQEIVDLYLSHGASMHLFDFTGWTPLHYAVSSNTLDLARHLLDNHGANPNGPPSKSPIVTAARNGHPRMVELLLSRGADPNINVNGTPFSRALMDAVVEGSGDVVKVLLNDDRVDPNARNASGKTALEWAITFGRDDMLQLLLKDGRADPTLGNNVNRTALDLIIEHSRVEMARMILADGRVDPNARTLNSETALENAVRSASHAIVRLLLADDRVDPNSTTLDGMTPFLFAADSGSDSCLQILLADKRVNLYARNNAGANAWTIAFRRPGNRNPRVLLESGVMGPNAVDGNLKSPVMFAACLPSTMLLSTFIGDERVDLNMADINDHTALMLAVRHDRPGSVALLLDSGRVDVNLQSKNGETALMMAVSFGRVDIARLLLASPCIDVNLGDCNGMTALAMAYAMTSLQLVEMILDTGRVEFGKAVRPKKIEGFDAGLVSFKSEIETRDARYLDAMIQMYAKADQLNAKDRDGLTMLEAAVQINDKYTVGLLLSTGKVCVAPKALECCRDDTVRQMVLEYRSNTSNCAGL